MAGGLGCRPFLALHELAKRQHEARSGAEVSSFAGRVFERVPHAGESPLAHLLISNSLHLLAGPQRPCDSTP